MNNSEGILILVPGSEARGGITNYFSSLKSRFSSEVEYFIRGARHWPVRKGHIRETYRALKDIFRFISLLKTGKFSLLQTNTSIGSFGLIRDGIFIWIAEKYGLQSIVFFRGLHNDVQDKIENKYLRLFNFFFLRTSCAIVLSSKFKKRLQKWGYQNPIYVETTLVEDELVKKIDEKYINTKFVNISQNINLLFLARIEKSKGIYEAIDTFKILKSKYKNLNMTIAGDGFELENTKKYVEEEKISGIEFVGFVKNSLKIQIFMNAHIYIFTSHSEGMPTSVLEAMAFGIPVVTRAVGGLTDFFINKKNGYITDSKDPIEFAKYIETLILNKNLMEKIALNNYRYAKEKFMASSVAKRLENIYEKFI